MKKAAAVRYVIKCPRSGMTCIKFLSLGKERLERVAITHGSIANIYWRGFLYTESDKKWSDVFMRILSYMEEQVGQGTIKGAYVYPNTYYKVIAPPETIESWEADLRRVANRVTQANVSDVW